MKLVNVSLGTIKTQTELSDSVKCETLIDISTLLEIMAFTLANAANIYRVRFLRLNSGL